MLKLKNAQSLSRTDMKNLMGGTNDAKAICLNSCFLDEQTGERSCPGGKPCRQYVCNPIQPSYGYRCS